MASADLANPPSDSDVDDYDNDDDVIDDSDEWKPVKIPLIHTQSGNYSTSRLSEYMICHWFTWRDLDDLD